VFKYAIIVVVFKCAIIVVMVASHGMERRAKTAFISSAQIQRVVAKFCLRHGFQIKFDDK
jgi:hypothetical protein